METIDFNNDYFFMKKKKKKSMAHVIGKCTLLHLILVSSTPTSPKLSNF